MTVIFLGHGATHCCKSQSALPHALAHLVIIVPAWLGRACLGTMFHRLASGYTSHFHPGTAGNFGGFGAGSLPEHLPLPWLQPHCPGAARLALRAEHPSSSGDTSWLPGQDILKDLLMKGDNRAPHLPVPGVSRVRFPLWSALQLTPGLEGTELLSEVTSRDEQGVSHSTQGRFGPNPCDILYPEREKNSRRQAGCRGGDG